MSLLPKSRPQLDRLAALAYLAFAAARYPEAGSLVQEAKTDTGVHAQGDTPPPAIWQAPVVLVIGVRGYYLDSMGKPGANDRGEYDDAIVVLTPSSFAAFNANTDPSRYREGIAALKAGVWLYKPGIHGLSKPEALRYPAFVQEGEVTVARDGQGAETGFFGINIHRGGENTTSSLGCQTVPPGEWEEFRALLNHELRMRGQKKFAYVLIDEKEFRAAQKTTDDTKHHAERDEHDLDATGAASGPEETTAQ